MNIKTMTNEELTLQAYLFPANPGIRDELLRRLGEGEKAIKVIRQIFKDYHPK